MGVPNNDPKTPPLEIVKVPPAISSTVILPSLPLLPSLINSFSTVAKDIFSVFLRTGTMRPVGVATATEIST